MTEDVSYSPVAEGGESLPPRPIEPESAPDVPYPAEAKADWPSIERQMILRALVQAKGKRGKASEILGWGRSTLWRKMKQYEIDM